MYPEILTREQKKLLPLIRVFSDQEYYLVGGTAIALQLGHRHSVDFDLFSYKPIKRQNIKKLIEQHKYPTRDLLFEDSEQLHIVLNSVKTTFFHYPHKVTAPLWYKDVVAMPDLLSLAAMKAYALGGRGKWKDYVDLYFLLRDHFTMQAVAVKSKELFGHFFNAKLFREQLSYFDDVDYGEKVTCLSGHAVTDEAVRAFLVNVATQAI
jgi:hypothetical protein